MQNLVPLPKFLYNFQLQQIKSDDVLFIEYHFLAQLTLRTLINRARESTQHTSKSKSLSHDRYKSSRTKCLRLGNLFNTKEIDGPSEAVTQELVRQLDDWRVHLPPALAWDDQSVNDILGSNPQRVGNSPIDTFLGSALAESLRSRIALNANLRTRYKYTEYIIWRPYIFKVLHSPREPTSFEIQACRKAFEVRDCKCRGHRNSF